MKNSKMKKDFRYYLVETEFGSASIGDSTVHEALVRGYFDSILANNLYNPVFFYAADLPQEEQERLVYDDIRRIDPQVLYTDEWVANLLRGLTDDLAYTVEDFRQAYFAGFKLALHRAQKMDLILTLDGASIMTQVIARMLSYEQRAENAARAAARIVMRRVPVDPSQEDEIRRRLLNASSMTEEQLSTDGIV